MELAHLNMLRPDLKPESLHVGLSMLNLPGSQPPASQTQNQSTNQAAFQLGGANSSSMDSNITLWQFLLEMLTNGEHTDLIQWTNNEGEFKLLDAEAVARLWGVRKGKHQMNYDKLSRALRYYYDKNIIKKVNGQKFVYRFVVPPSDALGSLGGNNGADLGSGGPTSADMLSYSMQRSMGIQSNGMTHNPIPTSLPRPLPTNQSTLSMTSQAGNDQQGFFRRINTGTSSQTPSIKTELDSSSSSRPLTVANTASTPSPTNSTCSPGSVGSSSGVSSAGTSASNLSDVYHHQAAGGAAATHQPAQSTSGHTSSSRPSSTASTATHQQQNARKRKREHDSSGCGMGKIKIESPYSYGTNPNENIFMEAQSPQANGLSRRARPKPLPLDLTAVSNVNNNMPSSLNNNDNNNQALNSANTNAMNNLVAAAASPLLQSSPALLNFYTAALSANLMQNQPSPLATFAALTSPLHFAAATIAANSPTLNPMHNTHNSLNSNGLSIFGNSLSALTTPIPTRTPQQPASQSHGQFFQFPPSSQAAAHLALAAMLRSPGLHSPFLTAMGLGTPTAQSTATNKFNLSPNEALKTPIPTIREI